jgi:phage shock protein E
MEARSPFKIGLSREILVVATALFAVIFSGLSPVGAAATDPPATLQSPVSRIDRGLLLGFLADNSTLTLIDARSPEEFATQHLSGAINVPFDTVDANVELLPADKEKLVVVYCRTGIRAGKLKAQLIAKGYADVQVLPREQIHWEDSFMVFNCSTESATTAANPPLESEPTPVTK